jgi:hypothetical protein
MAEEKKFERVVAFAGWFKMPEGVDPKSQEFRRKFIGQFEPTLNGEPFEFMTIGPHDDPERWIEGLHNVAVMNWPRK